MAAVAIIILPGSCVTTAIEKGGGLPSTGAASDEMILFSLTSSTHHSVTHLLNFEVGWVRGKERILQAILAERASNERPSSSNKGSQLPNLK
jgi:hypothetical protein